MQALCHGAAQTSVWGANSSAVSRMLTRQALVSTFVVASDASHELLRFTVTSGLDFGQELLGVSTAQHRSPAAPVEDCNFAGAQLAIGEPEVVFVVRHVAAPQISQSEMHHET